MATVGVKGLMTTKIITHSSVGFVKKYTWVFSIGYGWRDGLVVSALDQLPRGRGFESAGCGLSCSNRGPVALCTLGLGLLNPPSSLGQ